MNKYYNTNNNTATSGGIGVLGVLQIIFCRIKGIKYN